VPAVWVAATVLAVGALLALLIPGRRVLAHADAGSGARMTLEPARSS
jgi:hypothetical protein